jgi:hypothetical protein
MIPLKPNFFMNKFNIDLANAIVRLDNKINSTFGFQYSNEEEDEDLEQERSENPLSGSAYMDEGTWVTKIFSQENVSWNPKVTYKEFLLDPEARLLADYIGEVVIADSQGGGEGGGEDVYIVYHFKKWDLYIEFFGYYYSYDGSTYQGCHQVNPKPKVAYDWIPV